MQLPHGHREDSGHFNLHCPQFDSICGELFGLLSEIPVLDLNGMDTIALYSLLLYRSSQLNLVTTGMIFDATKPYIRTIQRCQ